MEVELPPGMRYRLLCRATAHRAVEIEGDPQLGVDRCRCVVHRVQPETVQPLVGRDERDRRPGSLEIPVDGLGPAAGIDDSPAGARREVAGEPDEPAAACRSRTPPFGKGPQHRFAGRDAAEREIALAIAARSVVRLDVEELPDVVIADVFEVPVGASVAGTPVFPAVAVSPTPRSRSVRCTLTRLGHVRERQALGGEPDAAPPRIVERPPVRADAVVVADAGVDVKRQRAAEGDVGSQMPCGAAARTISARKASPLAFENCAGGSPSIAAC